PVAHIATSDIEAKSRLIKFTLHTQPCHGPGARATEKLSIEETCIRARSLSGVPSNPDFGLLGWLVVPERSLDRVNTTENKAIQAAEGMRAAGAPASAGVAVAGVRSSWCWSGALPKKKDFPPPVCSFAVPYATAITATNFPSSKPNKASRA